jgi:hypothetical protein
MALEDGQLFFHRSVLGDLMSDEAFIELVAILLVHFMLRVGQALFGDFLMEHGHIQWLLSLLSRLDLLAWLLLTGLGWLSGSVFILNGSARLRDFACFFPIGCRGLLNVAFVFSSWSLGRAIAAVFIGVLAFHQEAFARCFRSESLQLLQKVLVVLRDHFREFFHFLLAGLLFGELRQSDFFLVVDGGACRQHVIVALPLSLVDLSADLDLNPWLLNLDARSLLDGLTRSSGLSLRGGLSLLCTCE